ncbi:hypothetical protein BFW01_g12738 [Lasiodiplodia theobromae]|uniref:BTB/POZ domain containing protein n=1 Tax=Lasiodiplodia theobromae TaxID=45133 RepID=UPI0015C3CB24|nr:BTB/POZ domain containing protein [Lasiodiplodia theobromae]KAF4541460.1 BTB/POZ domain containing protein [Lasiodiplodia theobromae]KAF9640932.1 hypothetical protein BFW01_g12738 [Lasiodiplodia theobromae]
MYHEDHFDSTDYNYMYGMEKVNFHLQKYIFADNTAWEFLPENDEVLGPILVRIAEQTLCKLWDRDAFEETVQNASGFGAALLQKLVKFSAIDRKNSHGVHS